MAPRRHPAWPSSRPTASRMRAAGCRTMSCSHGTLARSRSPAAYADQHTAPIRLTGGGFVLAAPKRKDPRPLPSADLFHCCTTAIPHHQYHLCPLLHNQPTPVPPPFTVAHSLPLAMRTCHKVPHQSSSLIQQLPLSQRRQCNMRQKLKTCFSGQ